MVQAEEGSVSGENDRIIGFWSDSRVLSYVDRNPSKQSQELASFMIFWKQKTPQKTKLISIFDAKI